MGEATGFPMLSRDDEEDIVRVDFWDNMIMDSRRGARPSLILKGVRDVSPEQGRRLLREWWTDLELTRGYWRRFVKAFEKCGYVTDTDRTFADEERVVVYRGDLGGGDGLSWTTDRSRADWFARRCGGFRLARGCGASEGGVPTVWQAEVCGREILGYFEGRQESEVVLRPLPVSRRTIIDQGTHLAPHTEASATPS